MLVLNTLSARYCLGAALALTLETSHFLGQSTQFISTNVTRDEHLYVRAL
jgi:hypothetical protein